MECSLSCLYGWKWALPVVKLPSRPILPGPHRRPQSYTGKQATTVVSHVRTTPLEIPHCIGVNASPRGISCEVRFKISQSLSQFQFLFRPSTSPPSSTWTTFSDHTVIYPSIFSDFFIGSLQDVIPVDDLAVSRRDGVRRECPQCSGNYIFITGLSHTDSVSCRWPKGSLHRAVATRQRPDAVPHTGGSFNTYRNSWRGKWSLSFFLQHGTICRIDGSTHSHHVSPTPPKFGLGTKSFALSQLT